MQSNHIDQQFTPTCLGLTTGLTTTVDTLYMYDPSQLNLYLLYKLYPYSSTFINLPS